MPERGRTVNFCIPDWTFAHLLGNAGAAPAAQSGDDAGEKVTCWPAPENSTNLNKRQLGS
jgi:hypothetical protein